MTILKLTAQLVAHNLYCPDGKLRSEFCDTEVPGLYIEVRASKPGQGTYYLRYKDTYGKTCHQKIARTTDMDLAEARRQAKLLRADIVANGADPRAEAKAQRAVLTVSDFFELHYLPHAKAHKRSWMRDETLYRIRIKPKFGDRRMNQLTRHELQTFLTELAAEGMAPASADHHLKLMRHAFNLAIDWGMLDANPAIRIKLFNADNKLENYLDEDELSRLIGVLKTDSNRGVCNIAMFLLSTGARLNEALKAKWCDIDRTHRVWKIPAAISKSKKVRSVPLNDSALSVLDELGSEGEHEHLFVNMKSGEAYTAVHKTWNRLRLKAKLPNLRLHDLRHQYASLLVCAGHTLYEVQQILGHSDPAVTQRYAHLSTERLQKAANSASVLIRGATKLPDAA